jgi:DNA-binding GntR family transcriptional regulator
MAQHPTKTQQVYEIVKQAIISGKIKPGEILNVADLAQKYEMGKTPTREALLLLTHENLLESMPRVGYVISRLTTRDLLEIYALRTLLEVEAIGLAAERITPAELALIEQNNQQEAQLGVPIPAGVNSQAYQLNTEFHLLIAKASGNARLEKLVGNLINDLERALSFDPYLADPTQHVEIINSLKSRDKAIAQEAMKKHLLETRLRILNLF